MLFVREPWWGTRPRATACSGGRSRGGGARATAPCGSSRRPTTPARGPSTSARAGSRRRAPPGSRCSRSTSSSTPVARLACQDHGVPRLRDGDARPLGDRAAPLIEDAAERSRVSMRTRLERLRASWRSILQAGVAAGLAWIDRHRGVRPRAAVLRAGVGDHHARADHLPARAARGRVGDRRRASGSRSATCSCSASASAPPSWRSWSCSRPRSRSSSAAARCSPRRRPCPRRSWPRSSPRPSGITFARFLDALAGGDRRPARQRARAAGRSGGA